MFFDHTFLAYRTEKIFQVMDLTEDVLKFLKKSRVKNGLVNIQTFHTTTGLILNENEPLLMDDFIKNLEGTSPQTQIYRHDNMEARTVNVCDGECANGHAHCKAIHLSANLTLNLIDGNLQLGRWQRILFLELDRARDRKIQVLVLGE